MFRRQSQRNTPTLGAINEFQFTVRVKTKLPHPTIRELNYHFYRTELLAWNNYPHQEIYHQAWNSTRDQGNQERQPEPKRADPKKLRQSSTYSGNYPVAARSTKFGSNLRHYLPPQQ